MPDQLDAPEDEKTSMNADQTVKPTLAHDELDGFCECGQPLPPGALWSCDACRSSEKVNKRRSKRESAERQLVGVIERCAELAADPRRYFFEPQALVLFGSMLKSDGSDVGDIDLTLDGLDLRLRGGELRKDAEAWADANAPHNWRYRRSEARHLKFCAEAARQYIRGRAVMVHIEPGSFSLVACGMPIPYKIVWLNEKLDMNSYRTQIDEERARTWAGFSK